MTLSINDIRLIDGVVRNIMYTEIRTIVGKTDDIHQSLCMHNSIVAREMAAKGIVVCRRCGKPMGDGVGRYNDHKCLCHPHCVQPICSHCADTNPDEFHIAFRNGIEERKNFRKEIKRMGSNETE